MSIDVINGIIQGGALVLLALVLWGISKKVDTVIGMAQVVVLHLLDLIKISTSDNATRAQELEDAKANHIPPKP